MFLFYMIARNALRHPLRSALTVLGLTVAILSFGLLRTVIDAWYAGAEAAAPTTLVTRNAISLVFPMPLSYAGRIRAVDGVTGVGYANWFGGIYRDPKNFFAQFAISGASYLDIYPDYLLPDRQRDAFLRDRRGAIVGRKLANEYGFRVGDTVPLRGTIYPGTWTFTVRGIYDGRRSDTNTAAMFFHWDYVNETVRRQSPRRADQVGVYVVRIARAEDAPAVARAIDTQFRNSLAETLTETEKAFQLGFVSMSEAIVAAIRVVSFVVVLIIMAVMANTMAMSARERIAEYATLKALGFGPRFLALLIGGESALLAAAGGGLGILLLYPSAHAFAAAMGTMFPVFDVAPRTVALQALAALGVALMAALAPALRAARVRIVNGLRNIG